MKKYITNILLFFAIVAMIDLCIGYFGDYLQAHAKGGVTMRINDIAMKDCHDVVVLGSSRAHHHYDTPFFRISCCGSSSAYLLAIIWFAFASAALMLSQILS